MYLEIFEEFTWIFGATISLFVAFCIIASVATLIVLLFMRGFKKLFPGLCKEFFVQEKEEELPPCCGKYIKKQTQYAQNMSMIPWFFLLFRRW